jgi:hypothetical protein
MAMRPRALDPHDALARLLSPKIVQAVMAGSLPRGIGITRLADLPASWSEQHAALGI